MADRIAVLNRGRLEQLGTPLDIYDRPASLFVNSFVGGCNMLPGKLLAVNGASATVALDGGGELRTRPPADALAAGARVMACIRPEHLAVAEAEGVAGTVELGVPLGASMVHEIRLGGGFAVKMAETRDAGATLRPAGTPIRLTADPAAIFVFPVPASA